MLTVQAGGGSAVGFDGVGHGQPLLELDRPVRVVAQADLEWPGQQAEVEPESHLDPVGLAGFDLRSIQQALEVLDARSRRVVEERWLKVNDDSSGGMTLHELAAEYGVSAERIRQIEVAAMKKMRKSLEAYA